MNPKHYRTVDTQLMCIMGILHVICRGNGGYEKNRASVIYATGLAIYLRYNMDMGMITTTEVRL